MDSGCDLATIALAEEPRPRPAPRSGPRPWAWLRRLALGVPLYALFLVGVWFAWDRYAQWRIQRTMEQMRAAGEPATWEEAYPPPATGEIAAEHYRRAFAAYDALSADAKDYIENAQADPRWTPELTPGLERIFAENPDLVGELRTASACPSVDWGHRWRSPQIDGDGEWTKLRQAARTLSAGALTAGQVGDAGGAAERVREMLRVGRAAEAQLPELMTHLLRTGIDDLACSTLEALLPKLALAPGDAAPAALARAELAALRDALLVTEPRPDEMRRAILGEHVILLDWARLLTVPGADLPTDFDNRGSISGIWEIRYPSSWRPASAAVSLGMLRVLKHQHAYLQAARCDNYPAAVIAMKPAQPEPMNWLAYTPFGSGQWIQSDLQRVFWLHFRALARRRMAAAAVAVRLYELDRGARPPTLAALVPDYLPRVPLDPSDPAGQPIRYLPQASPPRLYCVGLNGVDDGGPFATTGPGGKLDYDGPDLPFTLDGIVRVGPRNYECHTCSGLPTTQPVPLVYTRAADEKAANGPATTTP